MLLVNQFGIVVEERCISNQPDSTDATPTYPANSCFVSELNRAGDKWEDTELQIIMSSLV
jgi:hypothetical protein